MEMSLEKGVLYLQRTLILLSPVTFLTLRYRRCQQSPRVEGVLFLHGFLLLVWHHGDRLLEHFHHVSKNCQKTSWRARESWGTQSWKTAHGVLDFPSGSTTRFSRGRSEDSLGAEVGTGGNW